MQSLVVILILSSLNIQCQDLQNDGDYTVVRSIPYVENPHSEQYLDYYWPNSTPKSTIIFIHGGSLKHNGERRTSEVYENVCIPFVENGIGCATIDYRLTPEFQWPAMPEDVVSAFKKVQLLIEERNGNKQNIFLFGHSSGCTLAASVASNPIYLNSVGLTQESIRGVIPMGCILDNRDAALKGITAEDLRERYSNSSSVRVWPTPESWINANPSYHVSPTTPPTLVVVADEERFAPAILEQGARFVRLLRQNNNNVDAEIIIVPGTHYSSIRDIILDNDPTFIAVMNFIKDHQDNK